MRNRTPLGLTVGLCRGPYGGPTVDGAVSYERGTPIFSHGCFDSGVPLSNRLLSGLLFSLMSDRDCGWNPWR